MNQLLRNKSCLLVSACCLILSISCNKNSKSELHEDESMAVKYKSVTEIIKEVNKGTLENLIAKVRKKYGSRMIDEFPIIPHDVQLENDAAAIIQPLNARILTYLSQKYPQLGSTAMININDPDFTYFAQTYSVAEQSGFLIPVTTDLKTARTIPVWLRCTLDIIGSYFNAEELIKGLGNFEFNTVWTVIKSGIKKYVGWIAAAILIYDIVTTCL